MSQTILLIYFLRRNHACFTVTVYVGETSHRQYAGPDSLEVMAKTIQTSIGPSGKNIDYLYNLAKAMRHIDLDDEHIFELEKAVQNLEANKQKA